MTRPGRTSPHSRGSAGQPYSRSQVRACMRAALGGAEDDDCYCEYEPKFIYPGRCSRQLCASMFSIHFRSSRGIFNMIAQANALAFFSGIFSMIAQANALVFFNGPAPCLPQTTARTTARIARRYADWRKARPSFRIWARTPPRSACQTNYCPQR